MPEALDWIESEVKTLIGFQQQDGTIERWYGDGNWSRTLLLYAMWKTQGCFLDGWREGVKLGAVRDGERLSSRWRRPPAGRAGCASTMRATAAMLNFDRNYVRLNEWPEWFTVDENTLYRVTGGAGGETFRLGSELKDGIESTGCGRWIVQPCPSCQRSPSRGPWEGRT